MLTDAQIAKMVRGSEYAKFIEPTEGDVHVNRPLGNILINWMQDQMGFVAGRVFPSVPVAKKSDEYWEYDIGSLFRDDMKERGLSTESAGSTHKVGTQTYTCRVRALHEDIDDRTRINQDRPLAEDSAMTMILGQKGMINRERNWVQKFFVSGLWRYDMNGAGNRSGTIDLTSNANNNVVYWNNAAGTPIEDVRLASRIVGLSGHRPNVMVLSREVYDILVDHDDIIGRLNRGQTTGTAMANRDDLARLFEVEELLVMDGIYNSGNIAAANPTNAYIGGKHALLAFRAPMPSLIMPSAGYTFNWNGYLGATPTGDRIKRFRMEQLNSTRIEIESAYDQKIVAVNLACFFNGIVQ